MITRSTIESEFVALDKYREKVEWLRNFLEEILKWSKHVYVIYIHYDNQSIIDTWHQKVFKKFKYDKI